MRTPGGLLATTLLVAGFLAPFVVFAQASPSTTLRFGDTHADVALLQKMLNLSPDTRVATAGPGAPGAESTYFGPKTLDAVKRFQSKYRAEILVPAGLSAPTGVVGPFTLTKLQIMAASPRPTPPVAPPVVLSGLELYITDIKKGQEKLGYSADIITKSEALIRANADKQPDYQKQFFDEQRALYNKKNAAYAGQSALGALLQTLGEALVSFVTPETARAGVGLPFGGFVSWVLPCTCSPVAQIFVFLPNPTPTSNFILDYIYGSEGFAWYNLPEPAIATLGLYEPGVQSCLMYVGDGCIIFPAVGIITPVVGSSLTPL